MIKWFKDNEQTKCAHKTVQTRRFEVSTDSSDNDDALCLHYPSLIILSNISLPGSPPPLTSRSRDGLLQRTEASVHLRDCKAKMGMSAPIRQVSHYAFLGIFLSNNTVYNTLVCLHKLKMVLVVTILSSISYFYDLNVIKESLFS